MEEELKQSGYVMWLGPRQSFAGGSRRSDCVCGEGKKVRNPSTSCNYTGWMPLVIYIQQEMAFGLIL
jgi:hypothetical protein